MLKIEFQHKTHRIQALHFFTIGKLVKVIGLEFYMIRKLRLDTRIYPEPVESFSVEIVVVFSIDTRCKI